MNSTTQFLDLMKSFMNPEFYMSSSKNVPPVDFAAVSDTIKKGSKILATTNQLATESLQSMVKKNSEVFQNNTMLLMDSAKEAINSGDFKQLAECQQKYLKSSYENAMSNAKEFSSMVSDSSAKMMQMVNDMTAQAATVYENVKNKA